MKPNPLASLNHFTIPCSILLLDCPCVDVALRDRKVSGRNRSYTGGMAANVPFKQTHLYYTPKAGEILTPGHSLAEQASLRALGAKPDSLSRIFRPLPLSLAPHRQIKPIAPATRAGFRNPDTPSS